MVVIAFETCTNAKVDIVPGKNKDFFWDKNERYIRWIGYKNYVRFVKKRNVWDF